MMKKVLTCASLGLNGVVGANIGTLPPTTPSPFQNIKLYLPFDESPGLNIPLQFTTSYTSPIIIIHYFMNYRHYIRLATS